MSKFLNEVTMDEYSKAQEKWKAIEAPFTATTLRSCVTAAKSIINYRLNEHKNSKSSKSPEKRMTKYEPSNNLRIVINVNGNVSIYAHFPRNPGLKGQKLGEFPQLQLDVARQKANNIKNDTFDEFSIEYVFRAFEQQLKDRTKRNPEGFRENSCNTYLARVKKLRSYFKIDGPFSNLTAGELETILDEIIEKESKGYANELYAAMKNIWRFAANKYNYGQNPLLNIDKSYVTKAAGLPSPCNAYTDIDSIAELWINLENCRSIHQKNIVRFMILTGVRPINARLLRWEWFDSPTFPTLITFPADAMKGKKEFKLPVSKEMRAIFLEQYNWMRQNKNKCNDEFVFLRPTNPKLPFAKRSVDKIIKDYSPIDAIKGNVEKINVKGSNGAFCTMCRSFAKSNIKDILIKSGYRKLEAEAISRSLLHHIRKTDDPNGESYDKSDELYQTDTKLKFDALKLHIYSIMSKVKLLSAQPLRETRLEKEQAERKVANNAKDKIRLKIRSKYNKSEYSQFMSRYIGNNTIKNLILTNVGRTQVEQYLDELGL